MEKEGRQAAILEIIASQRVQTQEQLLQALEQRGIATTQATLSRDIRQLRLVKEPAGQGAYRYAVSGRRLNVGEKLGAIFRESVLSVDQAQNLVIFKTMPGLAGAACSALDHMEVADMVGSLAGDDTAFVAMRDGESAALFCKEIREMLSRSPGEEA